MNSIFFHNQIIRQIELNNTAFNQRETYTKAVQNLHQPVIQIIVENTV